MALERQARLGHGYLQHVMPKHEVPRFYSNSPELEAALNEVVRIAGLGANREITFGGDLHHHSHECGDLIEAYGLGDGDSGFDTPWTIIISGSTFQVFPGTLNRLLPTNIFTDIAFDPTGTTYVKLHCTTDGTKVTAVAIQASSTPVTTAGDATESTAPIAFDVCIAVIKKTTVYQIERQPIQFTPQVVGTTTRFASSGGEESFNRVYSWARTF